ncbi:MAG: hypothetical protein AMXMBFR84_08460 [Candidatus Hydrogenedentota bacterium]
MDPNRISTRDIAEKHLAEGDPVGWFEEVYATAKGDASTIPWADRGANPSMVEWLARESFQGEDKTALVVGCGLGDDAEELARAGFQVTAFDVSSTAVAWCKQRFAESRVDYLTADLFQLPEAWQQRYHFIFEANTLQSLPLAIRSDAMRRIANCLAGNGTLLVVCRGRGASDPDVGPPWPLLRPELDEFTKHGLCELSSEDYMDDEVPPIRRFRVAYTRK